MQTLQHPAIDVLPERKTSRKPPRVRRHTSSHRRRMAREIAAPAPTALRMFWDEHAVKTGMVVFYAWFAVANWSHVQSLLAKAW
jgi:hypothetical protein